MCYYTKQMLFCQTEKNPSNEGLNCKMVTRTGFEPMNACVKGMCVQPLHQRAKKQNGGPEWT